MVIAAGVDVGTESYQVYAAADGEEYFTRTFDTSEVKRNPQVIFDALEESGSEIVAGLCGYGSPIKRFSDLTEEEISLMTLSRETEMAVGLRTLIKMARTRNTNLFTIPGVIHLPTVPEWRKINRIDMGTPDKICSVALAINQLSKEIDYGEQNFILAEAGSGFTAFAAVQNGKIVDGIGGTSGFPSYRSVGSLDAELAYLLSPFPKSMIFEGGLKDFVGKDKEGLQPEDSQLEHLPDEVFEWLAELTLKGIRAVETSIKKKGTVVVSGRLFSIPRFSEIFGELTTDYQIIDLQGEKQSARGAAIIADGLANGKFRDLIEHLEIKKARGTVLDHITPQVKRYLDLRLD